MKYIGENAIKKLISLIKGDLATKQDSIAATGVLERDTTGVINGVETVGATLVETQEAKLVDVPNGLLKGDGTTISAAVAGTDYVNSSQAIRYDAAQTLTDAQKTQARANIAAAPDGFGLGTINQVVTDFDTIKLNGWYWGAAGTAHAPDSANSWSVRVTNLGNSNEVCIQDAYALININSYIHRRRLVYVSTATQNNPWEWVNPPMYLGVEYRTTERYLGKPVYVNLVDFGTLPNATRKIVKHNIPNVSTVISVYGSAHDQAIVVGAFGAEVTGINADNTNIIIWTSADLSNYIAYVAIKYTKTTD